jgi:hypothetical protein
MHPKLQASYYVKYESRIFVTLVATIRLNHYSRFTPQEAMMNPKLVVKNQNT